MARSTGKMKLIKRSRVLRWLPWILLSVLSIASAWTDVYFILSSRRVMSSQAQAIEDLQEVAVTQFKLFQAHVQQCSCSCNSSAESL